MSVETLLLATTLMRERAEPGFILLDRPWTSDVTLAVAALLEKVMSRHAPVEWHEADHATGVVDSDKPLPPFCRGCTDEEYVDAIDFGDVIDRDADVAPWPCPDFKAALTVARAYLGEDS